MNFSEIQERLRTLCLGRIQRGDLTNADLSRRTHLSKSHLSKFLHAQCQLSFRAADRIREALDIEVEDLLDLAQRPQLPAMRNIRVPLVPDMAALREPEIKPNSAEMWLYVSPRHLPSPGSRVVSMRRFWRRFVAIRIGPDGARSMNRPEYQGAIAVIDRHYSSLRLHDPLRPNLYAVSDGRQLALSYIDKVDNQLIVRQANTSVPAKLIEIVQNTNLGDYIAGRVAFIQHEP